MSGEVESTRSEGRKAPKLALTTAAAIAGYLVFNKLRPKKGPGENCFDIVRNLDEHIRRATGTPYFVMGGVAAAALTNPETIIDVESKTITPPSNIFKAQYRENGTLGDLDLLVLTADETVLDDVRAALTPLDEESPQELSKPGAKLKIGVTGLKQAPGKSSGIAEVLKSGFVSHRTQAEDGTIQWEIDDIAVPLSKDTFEPWTLMLPSGGHVTVMHPVVQMACYGARTGHGIRKRDVEKLQKMEHVVGPALGVKLKWSGKNKKVDIERTPGNHQPAAFDGARDFLYEKNLRLTPKEVAKQQGKLRGGLMAAKLSLHRFVDTHDAFERFGQGGPIFDIILSRITGERQNKLKK